MKIISASVEDPRDHHQYAEPCLWAVVDSRVEEIGEPHQHNEIWRVIPCGPFVAVERKFRINHDLDPDEEYWSDHVDLALFNTNTPHREQLIHVSVTQMDTNNIWHLQMGTRRAMRMVRRYGMGWDVQVDRDAALKGKINWILERDKPVCFSRAGESCRVPVVQIIIHRGVHIPYCTAHLDEHNKHIDFLRRRSTSRAS